MPLKDIKKRKQYLRKRYKRLKKWYKNHNKKYYKKNKSFLKKKLKKQSEEWFKKNKVRRRRWARKTHLANRYNISITEYRKMLKKQKNRCWICEKRFTYKHKLHVDHNPKTKKIRGLLHHSCNIGLGCFKHNIKLLKKAIKYLEYFEKRGSK